MGKSSRRKKTTRIVRERGQTMSAVVKAALALLEIENLEEKLYRRALASAMSVSEDNALEKKT